MNRQIKFRGYSNELKSWVYGFFQEVEAEGIGYSYIFWQGNTTPVRTDSVAQFTGIHDKNGKEIYEGDILKIYLYDDEWKTKVRDYCGTLIIDVEGCDWNTTALSFLDDEALCEVIGNIYENPELLK